MPIKFVTLSESYAKEIEKHGYEGLNIRIENYIPTKKTYYVSSANTLCFFDGGIDYALSRFVFPNIEKEVKHIVREINYKNLLGRPYLPIGSSIILDKGFKSLVVAPTMLLPQNVSNTNNAYYATMAILYNILVNKQENLNDIDILFTSLCCGYGKMDEDMSIKQILKGMKNYRTYTPIIINDNIILNEPNLQEQPKYYQNTEWIDLSPNELVYC